MDGTPSGGILNLGSCAYTATVTIPRSMTIVGGKVTGRVLGRGVNDVTLDGTEVTGGAGTGAQQGTIDFDDSDRITVRNVHVHDALGACVDFTRGDGNRILDSRFLRCGQQGYHLSEESNTTVTGNEFGWNNSDLAPLPRYDSGHEAGGGKSAWQRTALFADNWSHHNGGPGLWCDLDCRGVTFRGNRVDHNSVGIFYEISHDGLIEDNLLWENGWDNPGNAYSGGGDIRVSSSRTTIVRGNVMAWSYQGIAFVAQNRTDGMLPGYEKPTTYEGNRSERNVVISDRGVGIHGWYQADGKHLDVTGNGSSGDRFWSGPEPQSARYEWASSPKSTLSSYQSTPGGSGSSYLNVFEKDVILSANGLPAQP